MGCYDSSLLRPLLSRSAQEHNATHQNQNNSNQSSCWNRRGKRHYDDLDLDLSDLGEGQEVRRKGRRGQSSLEEGMAAARKISLLIWKNLLLRKRHWLVTLFEILLPTLFALILVYGRPPKGHDLHGQAGVSGQQLDSVLKFLEKQPSIFPAEEGFSESLKIRCAGGRRERCLVAFAPNSTDAAEVVEMLREGLDPVTKGNMEWRGFPSEAEIEKFVASLGLNEVTGGNDTLRAAIIFESSFGGRGVFGYKIRMMDHLSHFSSEVMEALYPFLQLPGPDYNNLIRYNESGFTAFQLHVERALIKKFTGKDPMPFSIQAFPYPPHDFSANFSDIYFIVLPMIVVLGFIFIVPSVIRGVVNERETGIKELMKMCGIPNWMHWFAWTFNSMILLTLSVTIVVVLFFTDFMNEEAGPLLSKSNPMIWWITLFLYTLSSTVFCFFISSFFQKPAVAITVGIILWLTTYYAPSVPLGDTNRYLRLSLFDKMLVALLPNMGLFWAVKVMCGFEGKASGAQWNNLFLPISTTDNLTLAHVWLMFFVDTILYFLLTLYVEAVLPTQYGVRRPWFFVFQRSFWRRGSWQPLRRTDHEGDDEATRPGFEKSPEGLIAGVVLENLTKRFGKGKVAVDGVSVKMFDGEIFALLGHNGAGKTTTISCCIGMTTPSAGTIIINGMNARSDLDSVRSNLGLCPQHNLLFDELTVDEHLIFFGRLKGIGSDEAKKERSDMLQKLQLSDKANTLARALSGGQKRKLCLGISLIGRAKVVFLDEPTSGMDVQARRAIWDLLLAERGQRTIVLTTHFMEEADVLGDRIGIMAHGKLQCCGTPMFLKKYYGAGYTLSVTMSNADSEDKDAVLRTVQNHIPTATLKTDVSDKSLKEFDVVLPTDAFSTSVFPTMFKELQEKKESLGIKTIGLSLTTMDEVFIKADEGAFPQRNSDKVLQIPSPESERVSENSSLNFRSQKNGGTLEVHEASEKGQTEDRVLGLHLYRQQFEGLLIKRMMYSIRKWKMMAAMAFVPVFILVVAILSGNSQLKPPAPPKPLTMDLNSYKKPVAVYSSVNESLGSNYASLVQPFGKTFATNYSYDIVQELIQIGITDLASYRERHIVAAELSSTHAKAMFSTIPSHASPLGLNLVTNAVLRSIPEADGRKIEVTNHPFIADYDYLIQALQPDPAFSVVNALMFGALTPIGLALLAASYVIAPIEERLCKGKQLQFMTGVSPVLYWGASFVWDFITMTAVILVMVICFPMFQTGQTYTSYGGAGVIFIVLMAYGFAAIPFSYILSFIAGTVPGGFSFIAIIHIASGLILPFVVYIMEATPTLMSVADTIRHVGRFFPTFGASISVMRFVEIALKNSRCSVLPDNAEALLCDSKLNLQPQYRQCCSNCDSFEGADCLKPIPYISWKYSRGGLISTEHVGNSHGTESDVPGIGQELLFLFLLGIAYQLLLMLLEMGLKERLLGLILKTRTDAFQQSEEDEDVRMESERVHQLVRTGSVNEDALVVENLCKNYGSFAAVANLNFGVHHGECFGLLGVNGAGKTTSFRMLTGDEIRSNGNAFAAGCSLQTSQKKFLAGIGYCPQFDGIIGVLTGLEMVQLFARLRGVKNVRKESEEWLSKVSLLESKNVPCGKYSGGMKRRLSAAMAMVGDPKIVFLDEPTSGVDPVSRREFWKIITSIRDSGRAIVLTSHSMDEIAACCSRVGIMVNGQLQCIGSAQHLKNKFAQGYTISLTLKSSSADDVQTQEMLNNLEKEIIAGLSPCSLKDKHQTAMEFHVHDTTVPWDILFGRMEDYKFRFQSVMKDYSISETSLEEVFLAFARKQYPSRTAEGGEWWRILPLLRK